MNELEAEHVGQSPIRAVVPAKAAITVRRYRIVELDACQPPIAMMVSRLTPPAAAQQAPEIRRL